MNNVNLKFENTLYVVPSKVKLGQEGIRLEWPIELGSGEMIEEVKAGCGCTAEVKVMSDRVVAIYNDNTKEAEVTSLPGRVKTISKNLRVYLKDGKPLKVRNERGVEQYNAEKTAITLFFHVNVFA